MRDAAVRDTVAVLDVGQGARCDEINERSYCRNGLVCHKCPADLNGYKCVRCKLSLFVIISSRSFIVQVTYNIMTQTHAAALVC